MQDDSGGMAALAALGARSVPVVALGDRFVFGQQMEDVAGLIGLDYDPTPDLSPAELVARLDTVLAAAQRLIRQLPHHVLDQDVRERKRSHRELAHHIFRIAHGFLDAAETGGTLELAHLNAPPPAAMTTVDQIADYGATVRRRIADWWQAEADKDAGRTMATYWGKQTLHSVLERTTWHPAQHVRQLAMVLEGLGIVPDAPLGESDLAGLPLPEKVWDD